MDFLLANNLNLTKEKKMNDTALTCEIKNRIFYLQKAIEFAKASVHNMNLIPGTSCMFQVADINKTIKNIEAELKLQETRLKEIERDERIKKSKKVLSQSDIGNILKKA